MSIKTRLLGGGDDAIARARRPEAARRQPRCRSTRGHRLAGPPAGGSCTAALPPARRTWAGVPASELSAAGRGVGDGAPAHGWLHRVCALHRSWIDPMVIVEALPTEPRVWFLGSGATAFDRGWKERLLRRTGGLLPVWRGGTDISVHVRSAAGRRRRGRRPRALRRGPDRRTARPRLRTDASRERLALPAHWCTHRARRDRRRR